MQFCIQKEYTETIRNIINNPMVNTMEKYIQHSDITCLSHSIVVSYYSYKVCRLLRFDSCSAARGGLLHDFFLYDWHLPSPEHKLHGFTHPSAALKNSNKYFKLNAIEKDIIVKHMWPLTIKLPRYKEAFIVCMVDKFCALMETIKLFNKNKIQIIKESIMKAASK